MLIWDLQSKTRIQRDLAPQLQSRTFLANTGAGQENINSLNTMFDTTKHIHENKGN